MAHGEPTSRIGDVERAAARAALDAHLNAGRLGVNEYSERSAIAANATTANELADLFADLPAPHPKLPGIRRGLSSVPRMPIVLGTIGVVAVVGIVIAASVAAHAGEQPNSDRTGSAMSTATTPINTTTPLPITSTIDSPGPSASSVPGGTTGSVATTGAVVVRHHGPLTLVSGSHDLDIDAPQSDPQWGENDSMATGDINTYNSVLNFDNGTKYLLPQGQADYSVCSTSNGYIADQLALKDLTAGQYLCLLSSDRRYAAARVTEVENERVSFDVDTYDPPISN